MSAVSPSKLEALRAGLAKHRAVVVAFSGGVDSAFVLAVAHQVLGERVLAVTAVSESVPESEVEGARDFAASLGARHRWVTSQELANEAYAANGTDRCFHCKSELYALCLQVAREEGGATVLDGFNADDRSDHRPGHVAAREAGVISPLDDADLSKEEIRALSRAMGLSTWDKPAMPCLASRLPYGTTVTAERLRKVGKAEASLRSLGFRVFRVRYHGDVARLEFAADESPRLVDEGLRASVDAGVKAAGFRFVAVDLEPFRSGRMNDAVRAPLKGMSLAVL